MSIQSSAKNSFAPTLCKVPPGFATGKLFDGQEYLVLNSMLPSLHYAFAAYRMKLIRGVVQAQPNFVQADDIEQEEMAEGLFGFPADPPMSNQEKLDLHAEVLALQEQLGISYKDAAHRLYMTEVEKLRSSDKEVKAWANISSFIARTLKSFESEYGRTNTMEQEAGEEEEQADDEHDAEPAHDKANEG